MGEESFTDPAWEKESEIWGCKRSAAKGSASALKPRRLCVWNYSFWWRGHLISPRLADTSCLLWHQTTGSHNTQVSPVSRVSIGAEQRQEADNTMSPSGSPSPRWTCRDYYLASSDHIIYLPPGLRLKVTVYNSCLRSFGCHTWLFVGALDPGYQWQQS